MAKASTTETDDLAAINERMTGIADTLLAGHRARTFIEQHAEQPCRLCRSAVARAFHAASVAAERDSAMDSFRDNACEAMAQAFAQIATARVVAEEYDGGPL